MTETVPGPATRRHTIEQTGRTYLLVAGFPSRETLADALTEPELTVFCLFPHTYRADQTQVQLRASLREELARLGEPAHRCLSLAVNDPALGDSLDGFDFEGACVQALARVTPKQPRTASVPIPSFGPPSAD